MGDSFWSRERGVDHMGEVLMKIDDCLLRTSVGMEKSTSICRISYWVCVHLLDLIPPVWTFETFS